MGTAYSVKHPLSVVRFKWVSGRSYKVQKYSKFRMALVMQVDVYDAIRKRVQRVRKEMLVNRSTADEIKDKLEDLVSADFELRQKGKYATVWEK